MHVKIKKLRDDIVLPSYAHPGDVGLDVRSLEDYTLQPGEKKIFMSGFALGLPDGYGAFIWDKSSVGAVAGVKTLGGVFDAGFRGEYNVCLINLSSDPFSIKVGQKIAQIVIMPIVRATIEEVSELGESSRGEGGFGSTGTH